jgi:VanZ family protein
MSRRTALWALAIYVGALAMLTLGTSPEPALRWTTAAVQHVDWLGAVSAAAVERAANVLLFVPAGLLLSCALRGWPRVAVWGLCVAASAGTELVQTVLPGRDPTGLDVLANGLGAAVGVLLAAVRDVASRNRSVR